MVKVYFLGLAALSLLPGAIAAAQGQQPQRDVVIDAAQRAAVIEEVVRRLGESYHSREIAEQMEKAIRRRLKNKEYEQITDAAALAQALTTHLQEVSRDKHLRVTFSPEPAPQPNVLEPTPREREKEREQARQDARFANYGFTRAERLAWNVGYLDVRGFHPAELAGEAATSAMGFIAATDALIIDLRRNSGGDADMVAWLTGYFFDEPVLVGDVYFRKEDRLRQLWSPPYVPGRCYLGREVYLLTSKDTISAAEAFAYNLQATKRAVVVGEVTAGAANPGRTQRINNHFSIWMPTARITSPVTKTNWEGTGVKPDVEVSSELALKTAHLMALKKMTERTTDEDDKRGLKRALDNLQTELEELKKKQ